MSVYIVQSNGLQGVQKKFMRAARALSVVAGGKALPC